MGGIEDMSLPEEWMPNKTPKEFFFKIYTWRDLETSDSPESQLASDVEDAVALENAKFMKMTGSDKGGEFKGTIRVTMEYIP